MLIGSEEYKETGRKVLDVGVEDSSAYGRMNFNDTIFVLDIVVKLQD